MTENITHIGNYEYTQICGDINSKTFPKAYEIPRGQTGKIRNQIYDNCVAEVIAQIAEAHWGKEFEFEEHSEGFIYGAFRKANSTTPGMLVSTTMDFWRQIGTVPKKYFDIDSEMPEIKDTVLKFPELFEIAKRYKLSAFAQIKDTGKIRKDTQIKDAITTYDTPLVAVRAAGSNANHCIMLTGWDDEKGVYIIKNSYGERNGDKGFEKIEKSKIKEVYLPIFNPLVLPFTDVSKDDWFFDAIKNMWFSGMMNGTSATTFEPNKPMTRAEVATMFNRMIKMVDERFDIVDRKNKAKEKQSWAIDLYQRLVKFVKNILEL